MRRLTTILWSAVFVLVRKATGDKVLAGLKEFMGKGEVLQISLTKDKEDELRAVIEGATEPRRHEPAPQCRWPRTPGVGRNNHSLTQYEAIVRCQETGGLCR